MQALRRRCAHRLATIGTAGDALNTDITAAARLQLHHSRKHNRKLQASTSAAKFQSRKWLRDLALDKPARPLHNVYNSDIDFPFLGLDGQTSMFDANTEC